MSVVNTKKRKNNLPFWIGSDNGTMAIDDIKPRGKFVNKKVPKIINICRSTTIRNMDIALLMYWKKILKLYKNNKKA